MEIKNSLYINFTGKIADKQGFNTKPYLAPQKPDTFELTTPKSVIKNEKEPFLDSLSGVFNNLFNSGFDKESKKIIKEDNLDMKKFKSIVSDMKINSLDYAQLRRTPFEKEHNYTLFVKHNDEKSNLRLLDKNLNVLTQESTTVKYSGKTPVSETVMTTDFRTNTFNEAKFDYDEYGLKVLTEATKIKRDKQNRLIRKETYEKSDVAGVYNIKYEFPDGKVRQLSKATVDKKTGHVLIEKDMRSADMTRTQFRYEDDPKGNRIIDYKITSPEGKVLMKQSQSFEVIDKNTFRSSRNDKSYLIEHDRRNATLNVTDEQGEEMVVIPLDGYFIIPEKDFNNDEKVADSEFKIANMLKRISGDELFNLASTTRQIVDVDERLASYCNTRITNEDGDYNAFAQIATSDDPYIFLHELGHATDRCGKPVEFYQYGNKVEPEYIDSIRDDKMFKKIYEQERKNFLKEFPTNERNYIDYFIEKGNNANSNTNVGHAETIAETNAILNTYPTVESQGLRTQYLQQHFPRTIAYLSERLTQTEEY